jgi:hypothetical protein
MPIRRVLWMLALVALLAWAGRREQPAATEASGENIETIASVDLERIVELTQGTLGLEGSSYALTPDQAEKLLPLWRTVQSCLLQEDQGVAPWIEQIERQLTGPQLAAINNMDLAPGADQEPEDLVSPLIELLVQRASA